jgi:hypothetical protein
MLYHRAQHQTSTRCIPASFNSIANFLTVVPVVKTSSIITTCRQCDFNLFILKEFSKFNKRSLREREACGGVSLIRREAS